MYQIRTDLALETQEKMQEDKVELKGVRFSEEHVSKNLTISTVVIETENGAKAMEKPKGTYILQIKLQIYTHIQLLFLCNSCRWNTFLSSCVFEK